MKYYVCTPDGIIICNTEDRADHVFEWCCESGIVPAFLISADDEGAKLEDADYE